MSRRGERVWGEDAAVLAAAGLDVAALGRLEQAVMADARPPAGVAVHDAHVHLGRDADGHQLAAGDLVADLDRHGVARAVCFPANEPGSDGQFSLANYEVARAGREHPDRIVPFCRVDPRTPGAEAAMERAAGEGARGLKLHPVAQRFRPEDPAVIVLVRRAAERGWPVLIHAGFGARPLARPLATLADAAPDATLILAHAGRGDARALRAALDGRPGIYYDTSLATVTDLVQTDPGRLLFGSDRPYGEHASAMHLVACAGWAAGWAPAQVAAVLGGNLCALLGDDA
ncbi:MAG: amidohydrolase family protein [Miltoncostaeaceae bacterium]